MDPSDLDILLEAKSNELKELQEKKIHSLSSEIQCLENQLRGVRCQYNELRESFQYNLDLLNERDKELLKLENHITDANQKTGLYISEISDLKVALASAEQRAQEEKGRREEVQASFQTKLQEMEDGFERQYSAKQHTLSLELTEVCRVKQQLELQLSDLNEEMERKRREWERSFEDELSALTRNCNTKIAEAETKVFQAESKLKQVTGEREALRMRISELEATVTAQDEHITRMEQAVEHAEWDVNNYICLQQSRITELEEGLKSERLKKEEQLAQISNRASVAEVQLSEREAVMGRLKESHRVDRNTWERERSELSRELEQLKLERKCEEVRSEEKLSEAQENIQQLRAQVESKQAAVELEQDKVARGEVAVKLVEEQWERRSRDLRTELEMRKQDLNKYKAELSLAAKREEALRAEHEQELRLGRERCEGAESRAYGSQEELVRELTAARDQAAAEARKLRGELLMREEEVALLRANKHTDHSGPHITEEAAPAASSPEKEGEEREMAVLRMQNERFKEVIKQMTAEMEQLAADQNKVTSDTSTVKAVESQQPVRECEHHGTISELEMENERLREEVMTLRKTISAHKMTQLEVGGEENGGAGRVTQLERERDRLLELSNNLRSQLNLVKSQGGVPLQQLTERLTSAREILRQPRSSNSGSLLMSGDTSLNEEISNICRMVEKEENRPLSANSVRVTGRQISPRRRPQQQEPSKIPTPKPTIGAVRGRTVGGQKAKPKIRNYNVKK